MSSPHARLKEARERHEALASDLPKLEHVHTERLAALRTARDQGADLPDLERLQAAASNVADMLDTTRGDLETASEDIRDAEAAVAQHEADKARERARDKLDHAEGELRDIGDRFRELIEEPQRTIARTIADALHAHREAQRHGIDAPRPRLTRYVRSEDFPNRSWPWLTMTLDNIDHLARQTDRERRKAYAEVNAEQIEADRQARVRDARKSMLRRLRNRGHGGEHDRRERLEAEVGAELDAEIAAEAAA